jgi:hypothetical protein
MADGVVDVRLAEMVVAGLALRYVDRKSGEARDEGRTRPEVVMRQLTTRPGQARHPQAGAFRACGLTCPAVVSQTMAGMAQTKQSPRGMF